MKELREEFHRPLGRLTMAFSSLENSVAWLVAEMLGADSDVRSILESQISFAKQLSILDGLYRLRVTDDELLKVWDQLVARLNKSEEMRNTMVHSTWGIWWEDSDAISISRQKNSIKRKKGLRTTKEKADPGEIDRVAESIEETNEDLIQLLIDTSRAGYITTFDHIFIKQSSQSLNPTPPAA